MISEKNVIKRLIKELVDYYLYHELYQFQIEVDYQLHQTARIRILAPMDQEPHDLDQLASGLAVDKQPEVDTYYNSLLGTHCRDKNYYLIGQAIDDFAISTRDGQLKIELVRHFVDGVTEWE